MFCPGCGKSLPDGSAFCSGCGRKIGSNAQPSVQPAIAPKPVADKGVEVPSGNAVYSIKGARGRHIDVYENKCVIKTKTTIGSIIASNATDGEKTIYYKDCVGVQFKKSGFTIGYLQLETSASSMNNHGSNFFGENSFTFEPGQVSNEKMEEVANYIKGKIDEIKSRGENPAVIAQVSVADEIKKFKELLDLGVITQEEFDTKKKQLLGM